LLFGHPNESIWKIFVRRMGLMKKKYSKTTSLPAYSIAEEAWNAP
jgi:hypothetical protein